MDHRSLLDGDVTPTRENPNIFDDEFEVEDFDVVVDGHRPGQSHDREGGDDGRQDEEDNDDEPIRSASAHYSSTPVVPTVGARNSTRKSRGQENPFASPEDEPHIPLERTPSGNFTAHRSVSSASSSRFAGTSTPRFGSAGPSHPYSMYPQGTVARTPSVATTSTARPSRQSTTRYAPGPQHPYAMYTQGTGGEDDLDDDEIERAQNPVPVGFLGLGASYERRRGPDGEEQDILGDYGHTEQLPPYSRYPEDGPEKMPLMGVPEPPTALHSRAPVLGSDPGMSLMHTQMHPPQQQSMSDGANLNRQSSRLSTGSGSPLNPVSSSPNDSLLTEKSWAEKSWSERRKTRFGGIALWWYLLGFGIIAFIGALIGGVIGGYVEGQKKGEKHAVVTVVSTSLYDASLITGTMGTPPPTGTYPLTFGLPQETQAACLNDPAQKPAWNCDLVGDDSIWIHIAKPPNSKNAGASLFTKPGAESDQLRYGAQIGSMDTQFSPFLPVKDNDDPELGPAFYFQQQYNKLVVVPESALDMPSRKIKRQEFSPDSFAQHQVAQPSDKPWFCYWNDTFLEGFIYTKQAAVTMPTPTMSLSSSGSAASPTPTSGPSYPTSTPSTWTIPWTDPDAVVATTVDMTSTTGTYSGVASGFPSWMKSSYPSYWQSYYEPPFGGHDGDDDDDDDDDDDSYDPPSNRDYAYSDALDSDHDQVLFEYLVKVEERRLPESTPGQCVQYQVLDNGEWNVVGNDDGQQIVIHLDESDPPYAAYESAGVAGGRLTRRTIPGGCHCQWMSGQG